MEMFSTGQIASRAGVAVSTIHYYERIGLLPPAKQVNGKRRYNESVLQQLGIIRLAQAAGYTIAEIDMLLHDFPVDTPPSERWQTLAQQKLIELDERLNQIQAMKALLESTLDCACATLDECVAGI